MVIFSFPTFATPLFESYCWYLSGKLLSVPERALISFRPSFLAAAAAALWSPLNISLLEGFKPYLAVIYLRRGKIFMHA